MPSSPKPLVDHRIYAIRLRKMPEFLDVFNRLAMPILMDTLVETVTRLLARNAADASRGRAAG